MNTVYKEGQFFLYYPEPFVNDSLINDNFGFFNNKNDYFDDFKNNAVLNIPVSQGMDINNNVWYDGISDNLMVVFPLYIGNFVADGGIEKSVVPTLVDSVLDFGIDFLTERLVVEKNGCFWFDDFKKFENSGGNLIFNPIGAISGTYNFQLLSCSVVLIPDVSDVPKFRLIFDIVEEETIYYNSQNNIIISNGGTVFIDRKLISLDWLSMMEEENFDTSDFKLKFEIPFSDDYNVGFADIYSGDDSLVGRIGFSSYFNEGGVDPMDLEHYNNIIAKIDAIESTSPPAVNITTQEVDLSGVNNKLDAIKTDIIGINVSPEVNVTSQSVDLSGVNSKMEDIMNAINSGVSNEELQLMISGINVSPELNVTTQSVDLTNVNIKLEDIQNDLDNINVSPIVDVTTEIVDLTNVNAKMEDIISTINNGVSNDDLNNLIITGNVSILGKIAENKIDILENKKGFEDMNVVVDNTIKLEGIDDLKQVLNDRNLIENVRVEREVEKQAILFGEEGYYIKTTLDGKNKTDREIEGFNDLHSDEVLADYENTNEDIVKIKKGLYKNNEIVIKKEIEQYQKSVISNEVSTNKPNIDISDDDVAIRKEFKEQIKNLDITVPVPKAEQNDYKIHSNISEKFFNVEGVEEVTDEDLNNYNT